MDLLILGFLAASLVWLVLYVLPLGITFQGKVIIVACAAVLAMLLSFSRVVLEVWQIGIIALLFLTIISYVLATRFGKLMFLKSLNQAAFPVVEIRSGGSVATPSNEIEPDEVEMRATESSELDRIVFENTIDEKEDLIEELGNLYSHNVIENEKNEEESLSGWQTENVISPLSELLEEELKEYTASGK